MADVVAGSSEPSLGAIRLAWWREALERLDRGELPAEPRLKAAADHLAPRGVSGTELSRLEDGWLPLLNSFPWTSEVASAACLRGRIMFGAGARLLGARAEEGEAAGAVWSLVDVARHCSDDRSRQMILDQARLAIVDLGRRKPPRCLRPLTTLAALAAYDAMRDRPLDPGNGFGRGAIAWVHSLTGRFPRG